MSKETVDHPDHYTAHPSGVECIQITEHMGFNLGNAVKYVWRADLKGKAIEDLKKAKWYIDREIARREVAKPLCKSFDEVRGFMRRMKVAANVGMLSGEIKAIEFIKQFDPDSESTPVPDLLEAKYIMQQKRVFSSGQTAWAEPAQGKPPSASPPAMVEKHLMKFLDLIQASVIVEGVNPDFDFVFSLRPQEIMKGPNAGRFTLPAADWQALDMIEEKHRLKYPENTSDEQ